MKKSGGKAVRYNKWGYIFFGSVYRGIRHIPADSVV